ncbi:hypothetical protein CsSME_00019762 [Camellia sinensis var. sinensis]
MCLESNGKLLAYLKKISELQLKSKVDQDQSQLKTCASTQLSKAKKISEQQIFVKQA